MYPRPKGLTDEEWAEKKRRREERFLELVKIDSEQPWLTIPGVVYIYDA